MEYQYVDPETGEVKSRKVYFPIPQARVPVLREGEPDALPAFCQWGIRKGEEHGWDLPVTGWARLLSLKEGKWNRYHPERVKIPALRWMEKDGQRQSHWFDMPAGQAILGVLIEQGDGPVVYVVTHPAQGEQAQVHERAPLLTPL